MFELFLLAFLARGVALWTTIGYTPADPTGVYVYPALESACGALAAFVVYQCRFKFPNDSEESSKMNRLFFIVPSLVLGYVFHPGRAGNVFIDVCWTFAMCLESVAVLPQLFLFMSQWL